MIKIRIKKKSNFIFLCIVCLTIFSGCARLPDYALPSRGIQSNDPLVFDEVITYRQLTRDDFKATELPPGRIMHKSSINAYTCARIRPMHDSKFTANRARIYGTVTYFGSIQNIAFEAIMIPGCSWWNPALQAKFQSYVLQHEQIHFAIVELTARRLTAAVHESAKTFIAIEPTAEAVKAEITAKVNSWIRSATDESLATHCF